MKKFYFVGNAHLDPIWMWRWQEGSAEAKATVRSALDRMKEYPDFKFVCSSASVYQWIEDFDPSMFEEIRERIREGRWIVVGGWHVQPDCNLPSGEGFARQSLYSQRYFYDRFGVTAETGYNVDSFGHNLMLPQILKKSGMKQYVFMRPEEHEKRMPSDAFLWRSPDGSTLPAYRILERYCQNFNDGAILEEKLNALEQRHAERDSAMLFYGVGNHGGGPTKRNIDLILQSQETHPDREYVFSTIDDYFTELMRKPSRLPIHTDDLQHHASGCYAAVSAVKTGIREAENALLATEIYSMMAAYLIGKRHVTQTLAKAWKNVLFCHFHDTAGGCAIEDSYTDATLMLSESTSIAKRLENSALQSISWAIDTSDASRGYPIVLFNANPFDVEELVQINKQTNRITDADGNPLPIQHVQSQVHVCYGRADTIFRACVPAMGYATYYFKDIPEVPTMQSAVNASGMLLENEHLRVEFDPNTGYIRSIRNKVNGRELLRGKGAVPIVIDESEHDTWSHGKNFFTKRVGVFSDATVKVLENGPVRATIKVVNRYGASTLTQYFSLTAGAKLLDVRAKIDWHEHHKMLKLAYETAATNGGAYYEIPFGVIERPADGEEEPGQRWVAVCSDTEGYAIINSNKYSTSVEDGTILFTVIRSPLYGDHGKARNEECVFTDQGEHRFRYSFCEAACGDWSPLIRAGRQFNTPVTIILENNHIGRLPDRFRGIECSAPNVQISAIKRSEDGHGTVLRLYEAEGRAVECTVTGALLPAPLTTHLTPWSINTYYLPDGIPKWKEVLLTEFDI